MLEQSAVRKVEDCAIIEESESVVTALKRMCEKGIGFCMVIKDSGVISGVLTDGDIRRRVIALNEHLPHFFTRPVRDICNFDYIAIEQGDINLSVERAIDIFKKNRISAIPVVNEKRMLVGVIEVVDCLGR